MATPPSKGQLLLARGMTRYSPIPLSLFFLSLSCFSSLDTIVRIAFLPLLSLTLLFCSVLKIFSLDSRSLALFRVMIAATSVYDVMMRFGGMFE